MSTKREHQKKRQNGTIVQTSDSEKNVCRRTLQDELRQWKLVRSFPSGKVGNVAESRTPPKGQVAEGT